jgi:hypothetical protein
MTYFPLLNRRRNNTEHYDIDETFMLLTLHVNFYYDEIMKDQKILKFLDDSKTLLNKISRENRNMSTQQINSCFIAFNIMMYVSIMDI